MKESVLKSKVQRGFDRSTHDYQRDTVRREGRLIYQTAEQLKHGKLQDALQLLIRNRSEYANDRNYQQEISLHIALLHLRMGAYDASIKELINLMEGSGGISNQMQCRAIITLLVVLTRTGDFKKVDEALGELQDRLKLLYQNANARPQKQRIEMVRECSIKLVGLESLADCKLITSEPSEDGHEEQVKAIYKFLVEEFQEAKYHMVKALKYWRQLNHESECLVCLHFILIFNGKLGKPNQKYANEVSRLETKLHIRGDLKQFQERLNVVLHVLAQLEKQLSTQDKLLLLQRNHPIEATKVAIYYRLKKCIAKLNIEFDEARSQLTKLTKKTDPTGQIRTQLERQRLYQTEAREHLQNFQNQLEQPTRNDTIYLLSKYKYAGEAYQDMNRRTAAFLNKLGKLPYLLGLNRLKLYREVSSDS